MTTIKDRARAAVKRAIDRGDLVRPTQCHRCGDVPLPAKDGRAMIHAHHYLGYENALDVEWLCIRCHFKEDDRSSKEKNGRAKLTMEQVRQMRAQYRPSPSGGSRYRGVVAHSARGLAAKFGVSQATVDRIVRQINWIDEALK